jgi:5-(hydroxymethyl)furfural/furfural oxidase
VKRYFSISRKNAVLTGALARVLDGPPALRRWCIDNLMLEKYDMHGVLNDQAIGEAFVREAATGVWHCTSSNRMGAEDDRRAVTDEEGRVYGVSGLRVVDASIMPVVPCANTNFPTMMLAERIAAKIVEAA